MGGTEKIVVGNLVLTDTHNRNLIQSAITDFPFRELNSDIMWLRPNFIFYSKRGNQNV